MQIAQSAAALLILFLLIQPCCAQPFITGGIPRNITGAGSGTAATIDVNATFTNESGTPANVVNIGTVSAALLDFYIPKGVNGTQGVNGTPGDPGAPGTAATIDVNATFTINSGSPAVVTNIGTENAALLDFFIPTWLDTSEIYFLNGSRMLKGKMDTGKYNISNNSRKLYSLS
jgi:hypothetical protein